MSDESHVDVGNLRWGFVMGVFAGNELSLIHGIRTQEWLVSDEKQQEQNEGGEEEKNSDEVAVFSQRD